MNSVILWVAIGEWEPDEWCLSVGGRRHENGKVMVEYDDDWLSVAREQDVVRDYDDSELEKVVELVRGEAELFVVRWRKGSIFQKMISSIPKDIRVVVDNDHGLIVPVDRIRDVPLENWIKSSESQGLWQD